ALVGADGLKAVWRAASTREAAYQPPGQIGPSNASDGPADWSGLLDLVAERTGVDATSLWSTWVVTPAQATALAGRTSARALFSTTVARARPWLLPPSVLDALNAWQFDRADSQLTNLGLILDQRDRITAAASAAGLDPPTTLATAFQQGTTAGALTEAANELQVIDAITTASRAEPAAPSLVQTIGLVGSQPDEDLAAAVTAFSAGDLVAARDRALAADSSWSQADDQGSFRIRIALATILVAAVLLGYLIAQLRRLGRLGSRARGRVRAARSADRRRGTLGHQPVPMARRIRPGPDDGDQSP
ncbi:MAG: hypothetical protein ACRDGQ_13765, partial [Candidatus Limnocylindrales bacterium]